MHLRGPLARGPCTRPSTLPQTLAPAIRPCPAQRVALLPPARYKPDHDTQVGAADSSKVPITIDDIECVATGLGDVSCVRHDPRSTFNGSPTVAQQATQLSSLDRPASLPTTDSDETGTSGNSLMQQFVNLALLVSPFAFWGTSMCAMKGIMAHSTPLLLGSFRLLPAGIVLLMWAESHGRPSPKTMEAWLWVAAFALVDGAAFQVSHAVACHMCHVDHIGSCMDLLYWLAASCLCGDHGSALAIVSHMQSYPHLFHGMHHAMPAMTVVYMTMTMIHSLYSSCDVMWCAGVPC